MINGTSFDMGSGPDLKGSWKNYRTGEVLTIRDTIFEDGQLVGVATSGAMVPYSRLQSFVKCDASEVSSSPIQSTKATKATPKPFVDDLDDIYKEGDKFSGPSTNILNTPVSQLTELQSDTLKESKKQLNDSSIEKVLDGLKSSECPKISIDLRWDSIPEGIIFLQKYLDKSTEDIANACINRYVDLDKIREQLEKKLRQVLERGLEPPKEVKKESNKKTKS